MNELQVKVELKAGSINTNTEEIKEWLSERMEQYKNALFTEESKQVAKSELASLRKLKKAIDERRKEIKAQCMAPYDAFEKEVNQLKVIIDEPINLIDRQLREMEEERIRKKRIQIRELYEDVVGEAREYLPYDSIYDTKWDNAGTAMKKIRETMENLVTKTAQELSILQNSVSDVCEEAMEMYKKDRDLAKALSYINTYETNKKKALEAEEKRRQQEEDRRREEEIARAKAEERKRMEELEEARQEEREKLKKQATMQENEPLTEEELEDEGNLPFTQPTTVTAYYRVVATLEELEQVEMAFNSMGIYFERRAI